MDVVILTRSELTEEQVEAFRRAAGERGVDAVVDWKGRPHVVTEHETGPEEEEFRLEPIPRPFG